MLFVRKLSKQWRGPYLEWGICNFLPKWDLTSDSIMKTGDTVRPVGEKLWAPIRQEQRSLDDYRHACVGLRARNLIAGYTQNIQGSDPVNRLSYILILQRSWFALETGDRQPRPCLVCCSRQGQPATRLPCPPAHPPYLWLRLRTQSCFTPLLQHVQFSNTFPPPEVVSAVGGIYKDPFGGVIRRLTNTVGKPNQEDIYGHHWANANGTFAFSRQSTGAGTTTLHIISTITGATVYTDQPLGSVAFDIAWDAIDPDKYTTKNLTCRNLVSREML
jgi:hypothetical protein